MTKSSFPPESKKKTSRKKTGRKLKKTIVSPKKSKYHQQSFTLWVCSCVAVDIKCIIKSFYLPIFKKKFSKTCKLLQFFFPPQFFSSQLLNSFSIEKHKNGKKKKRSFFFLQVFSLVLTSFLSFSKLLVCVLVNLPILLPILQDG